MTRFFVHEHGATREVTAVAPAWLKPGSGVTVWADFVSPTDAEGRMLSEVFGLHDLAVESALHREPHPKIESYGDYLYLVFQDRVTGILDAHLASVSNRLADVSRLPAVIATLFGPLTVLTGLFAMNVPLPVDEAWHFREIVGLMGLSCAGMYWWFKRSGWL